MLLVTAGAVFAKILKLLMMAVGLKVIFMGVTIDALTPDPTYPRFLNFDPLVWLGAFIFIVGLLWLLFS